MDDLTPPQKDILDAGLLTTGFNCILQLPTGGGKTWLAEQAIDSVLRAGRRSIYLTPLRALAEELLPRWRERFPGTRIGVFTGDYESSNYPVSFRDAQIYIMTPERLDACTRTWRSHWTWIPDVDLIVADEIHLLRERQRGPRLEGALLRMQRLNPFLRILGLSATLGNRRELAKWLNGVEYASKERPIPLTWRIVRYKNAGDKPTLLEAEVRRGMADGGQTLVFVQSRRRAESLASRLCAAGLPAVHHHSGLSRCDRRTVENQFRARETPILIATSTLEMGINLPVRQVVLYDLQEFDGADFVPLTTSTVWQRIGRAGRRGLDACGEAVLLAPQWDREASRYEAGKFEPVCSGLENERALAEQILAEVASGLARRPAQIESVFRHSLAAHQGTLPDVRALVERMKEAGMLTERIEECETDDKAPRRTLVPTRLGKVATRHLLCPSSLLRIRRGLTAAPEATYLDLLLLLCSTLDCEPLLPADFEELDSLHARLQEEASHLLRFTHADLTGCLGIAGKRLLATLKTALAARFWTRTGDTVRTAEEFGAYPFEIERLSKSLYRLALAAQAMEEGTHEATALSLAEQRLRDRLQALTVMVRSGIDEEAATLTLVPGIGPVMAKRLAAAGMGDIEALALAEEGPLSADVPRLRPERAARWIAGASALVREGVSAYRFRDSEPSTGAISEMGFFATTIEKIDSYRLRRAQDLKVTGAEGNLYRVSGGTEPHLVARLPGGTFRCDCTDAAKGTRFCKHILAIRLLRGDPEITAAVRSLQSDDSAGRPLNLTHLWRQGHTRNEEGLRP